MTIEEAECELAEDRLARVSILQELSVAALELFDPERSPDAFLERLAERIGCYATLLIEIDPVSGRSSLVAASGLGAYERTLEMPPDLGKALAEERADLRMPHPALARPLSYWQFPMAAVARDKRTTVLLCFFSGGTPRYRGVVRRLVDVLHAVLIHRQLFARTRDSERSLDEQKTLLERVSDTSSVGMLLLDPSDAVLFANGYFFEMFRLDPTVGHGPWLPVAKAIAARLADPESFVERVRQLVAHPDQEAHGDLPGLEERAFEWSSAPVRGATGARYGRGMYFREVTERTRAAAERERLLEMERRARAAMEDTLRARDEFISIASHELRTPLSALELAVSASRAALEAAPSAPPPAVRRALDVAERQTHSLARLIDALLDVSRIRAGRLSLELEPVDLTAVARDVITRFEEESAQAGSTVSLEAARPVVGIWDQLRIEQVVTNLLANAIKYGEGRPIEVRVARDGRNAEISVHDQGLGVGAEDIGRIFDRFERAVPSQRYAGLGLGLYIVRQIVERHGGVISVTSDPSSGSTFTVSLPLEPPANASDGR